MDQPEDDHRDDKGLELLAALLRGEHAAWTQLVQETRGMLLIAAGKRVFGDVVAYDASDVVQSGYLVAFEKRATFRGATLAQFHAWLRTVVENVANSKGRNERTRQKNAAEWAWRPDQAALSSNPSSMTRRKLEELMAGLDQLPAAQREAVRLKKLEGWEVPRIAHRLNRTTSACYGLIKRGTETLGEFVRARLGEQDR